MPDYKNRADELFKEIEALQAKLPPEAVKKMREAVDQYIPLRKACLDELVGILTDDSASNTDNAARFKSRCESMQTSSAAPFENALKNITLQTEATEAGYGWEMGNKVKEEAFFRTLAGINPAQARDYLVANRLSLEDYTRKLDEKWAHITREEKTLQTEEQKQHQEVVELTKKAIAELATQDRTHQEKARRVAQIGAKLAGAAYKAVAYFITDLKTETETVTDAGKGLDAYLQLWLETNSAIRGRISNYQNLLQAEKGGVLPLFKETRKLVSEYWEIYGLNKAELKLKWAKDALDNWCSAFPTDGQKKDAKEFAEAAAAALQKHMNGVKEIADKFQGKWSGVFQGPLKTDVRDNLIEAATGPLRARTLVEINTPEMVKKYLEGINGYYLVSFEDSFGKLREYAKTFPTKEQQEDALKAIEACENQAKTAISERLKNMRDQIGGTLNWFQPSNLEKTFNRDELKDPLG